MIFLSVKSIGVQYNSMNISRTTGLPMINAMLSRISTGQADRENRTFRNPLIYKSLLKNCQIKDILILLSW